MNLKRYEYQRNEKTSCDDESDFQTAIFHIRGKGRAVE
jgi:hypothetical protein